MYIYNIYIYIYTFSKAHYAGILVKNECGDRVVRAALLICSVDLPARSMCANMKQFNGKYGCVYCENPGTSRIHIPMVRDWQPGPGVLRTHDSILNNAQQAVASGEAVCTCTLYSLHVCGHWQQMHVQVCICILRSMYFQ